MPRVSRSQRQRTVALDKPCLRCGRPIPYTYQGPIEGVCGRCVDARVRRRGIRPRGHSHGIILDRPRPVRSPKSLILAIGFFLVAGAAVVAGLLGLLVK